MAVAALCLLTLLLRLPSTEQPFDNDSGAIAYHARLITRGEPLYGTHHPAHHLPAVYYVYALAFALLGDGAWAVKVLLIPWTAVNIYLLYRLGALWLSRGVGGLAAVICLILTSHIYMWGASAEIELFANLPRVAAVLVLMYLLSVDAPPSRFIFVGILSAVAFLFKAVYLSPLPLTGFLLVLRSWLSEEPKDVWQKTLAAYVWVAVGFVAGLLPVIIYFGLLGLLPRLGMVFTLGRAYVDPGNAAAGLLYLWLYPLAGLVLNNVVFLGYSFGGLLTVSLSWRRGFKSVPGVPLLKGICIVLWYILSFAEAGASGSPFTHYCLLTVPPLSLLAAWFLLGIYRGVKQRVRRAKRLTSAVVLAALLVPALSISIWQNWGYYYHYGRYRLGVASHQDFLLKGWPPEGQHLVRVQKLADYLKAHTSADDHIYYWSGDVQVYYLADRRCPVDIIWPVYIEATDPYQRIFSSRTKYIVLDDEYGISYPDWLYAGLAEGYAVETVIDGQRVYRRVD